MTSQNTASFTPSEKFITMLCQGIKEKAGLFQAKRGKISMDVEDDRSFTIQLGNLREPLKLEVDETAELRMYMGRDFLDRMVSGKIDAVAELSSGNLRVDGDINLLSSLFQLMQRGKGMLALRASL